MVSSPSQSRPETVENKTLELYGLVPNSSKQQNLFKNKKNNTSPQMVSNQSNSHIANARSRKDWTSGDNAGLLMASQYLSPETTAEFKQIVKPFIINKNKISVDDADKKNVSASADHSQALPRAQSKSQGIPKRSDVVPVTKSKNKRRKRIAQRGRNIVF